MSNADQFRAGNPFISVEEFEGRSPSPSRRPDDGIRMRIEGTFDPSRRTYRPDDIKRQPDPIENAYASSTYSD